MRGLENNVWQSLSPIEVTHHMRGLEIGTVSAGVEIQVTHHMRGLEKIFCV